jgi:hypothetical protein
MEIVLWAALGSWSCILLCMEIVYLIGSSSSGRLLVL